MIIDAHCHIWERDLMKGDLAGEYFKRFPNRIIPFAGIDPRRGAAAVGELKR